ncbi:MAG: DUF3365 domain-containing protein [Gammaproteobacteria bacterium]|nr:DUF3365 domain-containing protein [Gammaproteobacteria bacterium]
MKIRIVVLVASVLCGASVYAGADTEALSADARGIVKGFFTTLKGELQAGMKSGGPVHALDVCNVQAPAIATDASKISGWEVGRTSLRLRNADNAPDAWERKVLKWFEARREEGQDPATMEYAELRDTADGQVFRYMKAIPQGEVCMVCHGGESVPPEVEAKIAELYPQDEARGFAPGDIRGAFTLSRRMAR